MKHTLAAGPCDTGVQGTQLVWAGSSDPERSEQDMFDQRKDTGHSAQASVMGAADTGVDRTVAVGTCFADCRVSGSIASAVQIAESGHRAVLTGSESAAHFV